MSYLKCFLLFVICWVLQVSSVNAESIDQSYYLNTLLQSGIERVEKGDCHEAQKMLTSIIDRYSNSVNQQIKYSSIDPKSQQTIYSVHLAYLNRGLAAYKLGNYQQAIIDLEIAKKIYPWQVEPHYNMGLVHSDKREYPEAIADFNRALTQVSARDETKVADIYNDRGLAYLNSHNFGAAIADFNLGLRYQANNSWLYYNLGCACHRSGDYAKAIASFSQALNVNPEQPEAYINRGLIHYHLGHIQVALSDLQKGANYFHNQGRINEYQKSLQLIKEMNDKLSDVPSLAV
jgi:tetratricopeptide (TPR) repeat protein